MPTIKEQQALGWGDPDASGFSARHITRITTSGISVSVNRAVAPIFDRLIDTLDSWGANLDQKADDWGYANRDIRGVAGLKSYHAWGLAVDLDATENPMGVRKTTFPITKTRALAKSLGLRWGYDYSGRPDPMHFEFIGSVADAKAIVAKLNRTPKPVCKFPLPVGHVFGRKVSATVHNGKKSAADANNVKRIQKKLGVKTTGFYGPITDARVRAWQLRRGLKPNGRVGANDWKRLGL